MDNDISIFLSSYGVMTAERILEKYTFHLSHDEIMAALKNKDSFFHHLLRVPFKNILNGIMLEQVNDFNVFCQKLYVDYLLTGESGKDDMQPGGTTRDSLEIERKELLHLGELYQDLINKQNNLIADSQRFLIDFSRNILDIKNQIIQQLALEKKAAEKAFIQVFVHQNYLGFVNQYAKALGTADSSAIAEACEEMVTLLKMLDIRSEDFLQQAKNLTHEIIALRKQFYDLIVRTKALLLQLPEYSHNEEKERKNKEALYFDPSIGEEDL